MTTEQTTPERRGGDRRSGDRRSGNTDINEKIDALIGMMTVHIHSEESSIDELKQKVDQYFAGLDAHIHVAHHGFVGEVMEDRKDNKAFWTKVKEGVTEKMIIFIMGALMSYLGAVMWTDFATRVAKAPPVQVNQQQVAPPPPPTVKSEVPIHP